MEKQTFLFVVCEDKAEKIVQETLAKNKIKTQSSRTVGDMNVFYVKGNENAITRLGMKLVGLKSSLPMQLEIFDSDGAI